MKSQPLVSICCITYNHEAYIKDALDGFLIQQTSFPFEIIIHDDASTDLTAKHIESYYRKHPKIIIPIFQKRNQYSQGKKPLFEFVFPKASGKYIAVCEGDDYWTDPYKLQRQVDYMESHPDTSLCFHAVEIVKGISKTNRVIRAANKDTSYTSTEFLNTLLHLFNNTNPAPSAALLFPKKCVQKIPNWYYSSPVGDFPLKLHLASQGNIFYMDKIMAARRLSVEGSWTQQMQDDYRYRDHWMALSKMLHGFDRSTRHKYSRAVAVKQFIYQLHALLFDKPLDRKELRKFVGKNRDVITRMTIRKQLEIYFMSLLPNSFIWLKKAKISRSLLESIFYR